MPSSPLKGFFHFLAVMLFVLLMTESVWALQCSGGSTEAIFRGEVISMVDKKPFLSRVLEALRAWRGYPTHPDSYFVTFNVKNSWMGVTTSSVTASTPRFSGVRFELGHEYLVYAHGPLNDPYIDLCSRTREFFGTNDEYLATLPELTLTDSVLPETMPIGVIALVGALASLIVFWERRRRKLT
jgi:hypothetical protein